MKNPALLLFIITFLLLIIAFDFATTEGAFFRGQENTKSETSPTIPNPISNEIYRVMEVIDGDTIRIDIDGKVEPVRLIGIDTPELNDTRDDVRCWAQMARNEAVKLLDGKFVFMEADETQDSRDRYNRPLRYLWIEIEGQKDIFFNEYMITEGYATEYTYQDPYKYQEQFQSAEKTARENKKGLWSDNSCLENRAELFDLEESNSQGILGETIEVSGPDVKKSNSGICHEEGTSSYNQTKNYLSFGTIEECLNSGGRLPLR